MLGPGLTHHLRVLIADPEASVRSELRTLLADVADIEVVAEAGGRDKTVGEARTHQPDVILISMKFPDAAGMETIETIKREHPTTGIIALLGRADLASFGTLDEDFAAVRAGALGLLLKETGSQDLQQSIRDVYHGETSLHPVIARKLIRALNSTPPPHEPLTEREAEVYFLAQDGLSPEEIATKLGINVGTIHTHIRSSKSKLGAAYGQI